MVAYASSGPDAPSQVSVYDRQTHASTLVSQAASGTGGADAYTASPRISGDGSYVAFFSFAANLVPGDDGMSDVFVRDLRARTTAKVSGGVGGRLGDAYSDFPSISTDGKYVAFESEATNLVEDDTNGYSDIFVHDRAPGPEPRFAVADLHTDGGHGRSPVRITASVKDVGEVAGTYQAVLWIDGAVAAERAVPVRKDQATRVSFEVRDLPRGTHTVRLGPLAGSVTVGR
jgi:Tol biopolymer transport system component